MIHPPHLVEHVIIPTLSMLGSNFKHPLAVSLLLGTCAQESAMGRYLRQIRGPAQGIYQMEPATETDIKKNYLAHRPALQNAIDSLCGDRPKRPMYGNLYYATAMARIHYWRVRERLPDTLQAQATYWKEHFNTPKGKGTPADYLESWETYVAPHHDF